MRKASRSSVRAHGFGAACPETLIEVIGACGTSAAGQPSH